MSDEEIKEQENAAILGWFVSLLVCRQQYDAVMHIYTDMVRKSVFTPDPNLTKKQQSMAKKKFRDIIITFSEWKKNSAELTKIMTSNPDIGPLFEKGSDELWDKLADFQKGELTDVIKKMNITIHKEVTE